MTEKLMTLKELARYLDVSEEIITLLVKEKVVSAYKLGGELLRFRKEQIDAIRKEIDARLSVASGIASKKKNGSLKKRLKVPSVSSESQTVKEKISDFLYFYDFYVAAAIVTVILLVVIFKG